MLLMMCAVCTDEDLSVCVNRELLELNAICWFGELGRTWVREEGGECG